MKKSIMIIILIACCINAFAEDELFHNVKISGKLQAGAEYIKNYADKESTNLTLDYSELWIDAKLSDIIEVNITYSWNDDEDKLELLEGVAVVDHDQYFITVGKMYVPFGSYKTYMVSDPLTRKFETNDIVLQVGFDINELTLIAYIANGEVTTWGEDEDREKIKRWGTAIEYLYQDDLREMAFSFGFINHMLDSDSYQDYLNENVIDDEVPGFSASLDFNYDSTFKAKAEYLTAMESLIVHIENEKLQINKPKAFNFEIKYSFEIKEIESAIIFSYQGTSNCRNINIPEKKMGAAIGMQLYDNTELKFEFAKEEDYSIEDGGTGKESDNYKLQYKILF